MIRNQSAAATFSRRAVCLALAGLLGWLAAAAPAAAQRTAEPLVAAYSSPQATFEEVLRGAPGEAILLYYLPAKGPERPALVVRLSKQEATGEALAEVYQTPAGETHVPVDFVDGYPTLPGYLSPALAFIAPDGWWTRDGITNYNLDITAYGSIVTMWGAADWAPYLEPKTPNAAIIVRDANSDGLPDWDWRTMLPEFPYRGDYRTNYAERKCDSPAAVDPGVSPQWPFVASDGGFEQLGGVFRPPIVASWRTGRIQFFSELVTVRNQNCSYSLYSIERVLPDQINSPNFETPFAFYDLSGEGVGYPNLLLRTQRVIQDEPLALFNNNPETQSIRYSWRNAVGDLEWDYKIDVLGQFHYDDETPIAGGMTLIDAPPYEEFPQWVIDRAWPAVSFVATEQTRYRSSEGIYEWAMLGLSDLFYFGLYDSPDLIPFDDIRMGLRGEYRLGQAQPGDLYLSPIDNRLHLKWAEHGIWRLDKNQIIRVANLDGDAYIDTWSREALSELFDESGREREEIMMDDTAVVQAVPLESLYALDDYLLYAGDETLMLAAADYEPALFETLPPTDQASWAAHRALLAPYEAQRRDPTDLRGWLDAFPGPRGGVAGAEVAHVRITEDGFRFELALAPGFVVSGTDLLGVSGLAPGDYLVERRGGAFFVSLLTPAALAIDVQRPDPAGPAWIAVGNDGATDALGLWLIIETELEDGSRVVLDVKPVDALAGETVNTLFTVPSNLPAGWPILARLETEDGQTVAASAPLANEPLPIARQAIFTLERMPVLAPVAALFSVSLVLAAIVTLTRRPEDAS